MDLNKHLIAINAAIALKELNTEREELRSKVDRQRDILERNCQHPDVTKSSKYYEGGYDYVSSIMITHTCDLCHKVLKYYDDPSHKGSHA